MPQPISHECATIFYMDISPKTASICLPNGLGSFHRSWQRFLFGTENCRKSAGRSYGFPTRVLANIFLFLWKAPGEHLWSGICIILFAQNGGCRGLSPTGCAVRCGGLHKLWLNKTASPVLGLSPFFRLPGCGMIPAYLSTFITFRPLANQPPIITHSPPRPTPPFIHTTHIFIFCSDLKSSTPLLHPFPPPAYAIVHGELEMLHNALPQTSRKVSKGSDFPYETLLVRGQFIR